MTYVKFKEVVFPLLLLMTTPSSRSNTSDDLVSWFSAVRMNLAENVISRMVLHYVMYLTLTRSTHAAPVLQPEIG